MDSDLPILEFDDEREALIEPSCVIKPIDIPHRCVLPIYHTVINKLASASRLTLITNIHTVMGPLPVYKMDHGGTSVTVAHPGLAAPLAAGVMEELIALGCRRFVACGSAGILDSSLVPGTVVVPCSAVRDEGVITTTVSAPRVVERLLDPKTAGPAQAFLREHSPGEYSMLRTSVVPTMLSAGVGPNVIPSQAEATLDIRALPGEDIEKFYAEMAKVIDDPAVKIVPLPPSRPPSPTSKLDTDMYRVMEQASNTIYPDAAVLPSMSTGASDQAQLRAKGIQSYGVGYVWTVVTEMAAHK